MITANALMNQLTALWTFAGMVALAILLTVVALTNQFSALRICVGMELQEILLTAAALNNLMMFTNSSVMLASTELTPWNVSVLLSLWNAHSGVKKATNKIQPLVSAIPGNVHLKMVTAEV
jgi:hypothetical protein